MIDIINIDNRLKWQKYLKKIEFYDSYHTADYHSLETEGEKLLYVYEKNGILILWPMVIKPIYSTGYFDVSSVYGYSGPVSNTNNLPISYRKEFHKFVNDFFNQKKIISAFARLHPLLSNQKDLLKGYGHIRSINKTVNIKINQDEASQWHEYSRSLKNRINKLNKLGFEVRVIKSKQELKSFIDIYYETMNRVEAKDQYFYKRSYFEDFLKIKDFEVIFLVASYDSKICAGGLFTVCNNIMQYHLGGTKNEFLNFGPMKSILDYARKLAVQKGLENFHLGGGYEGHNDSLFFFKTLFSKRTYDFNVWQNIINIPFYNKLVNDMYNNNIPKSNYFPLYRLNSYKRSLQV